MARALKKCHSDLCPSDIYVHCMDTIQEGKSLKSRDTKTCLSDGLVRRSRGRSYPWFNSVVNNYTCDSFVETNANKTKVSRAESHFVSAGNNSTNGIEFGGNDVLKETKSQSVPFETKDQIFGPQNEAKGILISNNEDRKKRSVSIGKLSLEERNLERIMSESEPTHSVPDYLEYKQNMNNRSCMSHRLMKGESSRPFIFDKNSFPQYLNYLLEYHPNAYAIDMLRHRMGDNGEDADDNGDDDSEDSNSDANISCNERGNDVSTKPYDINPLFKRVIIIGPPPKISYHPKKKFSAASKLSWKDSKMLMRTSAWNKRFYSSGNSIGKLHVQLRFLVISQHLRVNVQNIEFYTDYRSDGARMYIETTVKTGIVELMRYKSKDIQLGQETLQVEFEETHGVTNVGQQCNIKFQVFTYKKGIPKSHICLAEAEFNLEHLKANTDRYQIELVRP